MISFMITQYFNEYPVSVIKATFIESLGVIIFLFLCHYVCVVSGGRMVECWTVNRGGSIPSTTVLKLRQFHSPHICLCLSEETLTAGGPFYLVSVPGKVKGLTQRVNV